MGGKFAGIDYALRLRSVHTPIGARVDGRQVAIGSIKYDTLPWVVIRQKRSMLTDVSREVKAWRWDLDLFCMSLLTGCLVVSVSRESIANMYKLSTYMITSFSPIHT